MLHSLLVLILTAIACSLLGMFIILRNQSMITDAISHSVLLGIVLAFFITRDLDSPLLTIGATIFGILTVLLIEKLGKSEMINKDDSIGLVFPLFFSLAVLLISKYARNSQLNTDLVLMGEVIYSSLNTFNIFGLEISYSAMRMSIVLLLNLLFIYSFYKELKAATFSKEFAQVIGIPMGVIFYLLMTLTSLTSVVAFDAVGGILVVSFFISSSATSLLLSNDLKRCLQISVLFAIINSVVGFSISVLLNTSMSGMVAFISMINYLLAVLFNKEGYVTRRMRLKKSRERILEDSLIIHLANHSQAEGKYSKKGIYVIEHELNWSLEKFDKISKILIASDYVIINNEEYILTEKGILRFQELKREFLI